MITLTNVSKSFYIKGNIVEAVSNVNLHVEEKEIYGIVGLSGAGKSTLLRMVNFLEAPTEGTVLVNNQLLNSLSKKQLRVARHEIGMIFQHFNLLANRTVKGNVQLALEFAKVPKNKHEAIIEEMLNIVDLSDKAGHYPSQLSGGQKQRVAIARAISTKPKVLLCDEPTSALDPQTTKSILTYLKKINQIYGVTILIVTHEMEVIRVLADKVAVMEKGTILEELSMRNQNERSETKIGKILLYGESKDRKSVV